MGLHLVRNDARSSDLISTDVSKIELPYVISGDSPGLSRFTVSSHSAAKISVDLSSSLGDQLVFQLDNKNLQALCDPDEDPCNWNQLFNQVDLVEKVTLDPYQSRTIVVCFRPNEIAPPGALPNAADEGGRRGEYDRAQFDATEADAEMSEFRAPRHYYSMAHVQGEVCLDVNLGVSPLAPRGQRASLEFTAKLCPSLLKTDVDEIVFEGCVIGKTSPKDFTVWNCSEVPLRFRIIAVRRTDLGILVHTCPHTCPHTCLMRVSSSHTYLIRVSYLSHTCPILVS